MDTLVLIKQVPDTETNIQVSSGAVNESSIKWIISPYDEVALEEAVRTREKKGGTVTVISVGPDRVVSAIRTAYAMGADSGIHIKADDYSMLDPFTIGEALAKATEGKNYDIIFAGRQGIDSDNGQVPLIYAAKKEIGAIIWAKNVEPEDDKVTVVCEAEGGEATYEAAYPVVITAQMGMNEPRYPSLKGIMLSKKKPVETINIGDLGVSFGNQVEVLGFETPADRAPGRIVEGDDAAAKAEELVRILHEEAKII